MLDLLKDVMIVDGCCSVLCFVNGYWSVCYYSQWGVDWQGVGYYGQWYVCFVDEYWSVGQNGQQDVDEYWSVDYYGQQDVDWQGVGQQNVSQYGYYSWRDEY